jgi:hypothetical protein
MKLYRLELFPAEGEPEGEELDEYFRSERAARRRRKELLDSGEMTDGSGTLERLTLVPGLGKLALALAILNRTGYVERREQLEGPWSKYAEDDVDGGSGEEDSS